MTEWSVSDEALAAFRFQTFYEDVIGPVERRDMQISNDPESIFACGELREAAAIAALAVACGIFPREPFTRMLEYGDIPRLLAGDLDADSSDSMDETLPYPINALPDGDDALAWSEFRMGEEEMHVMPGMVAAYASLMRQVHRNRFQRRFNAELLFSSDDHWQAELETLASAVTSWFVRRVNIGDSIWLPEGLDSYFDLAEDLGASILIEPPGNILGFRISYVLTSDRDIVPDIIQGRSLLPFAAWRFGGVGGDLAAQVTQRINNLQGLVARIVAGIDTEEGRPVRYELREL